MICCTLRLPAQVTSGAKVRNLLQSNCSRLEPPKPWYLGWSTFGDTRTQWLSLVGSQFCRNLHTYLHFCTWLTKPCLQVLPGQYVQPQTYHLSWGSRKGHQPQPFLWSACLFHGDLPVLSSWVSVMEGMMHPGDSQERGRIAQASIAAKGVVPATSP